MAFRREHPHAEMQELVSLDYEQSMGLVVCVGEDREEIIAMARYDVEPATNLADVAFVVRDEWQRKGVGALLLSRMREIARARGVAGFTADILLENKAMMRLIQKAATKLEIELDSGVYRVTARFDENAGPRGGA